jgi:hypothetical protein
MKVLKDLSRGPLRLRGRCAELLPVMQHNRLAMEQERPTLGRDEGS